MNYLDIDTPALLIDQKVLLKNIEEMQSFANAQHVKLRPHTKTHKMPTLAKLQEVKGARGITVAKVGEAEVMAEHGLTDIFIANQIVGVQKLERIKTLAETINVSFGIDSIEHVKQIESVFQGAKKANILIEIEVGEKRSGVIEEGDFIRLLDALKQSEHIHFKGVFSHDGHTYKASSVEHCKELYLESVNRTLHFGTLAKNAGFDVEEVSIGSTPPFLLGFDIPEGVTEMRPGTYILMDGSQSGVIGSMHKVAATVLSTVISKPTNERVITDVGAKGLTAQQRTVGLTATEGLGKLKGYDNVFVHDVYDEHAIIYHESFNKHIQIGEKVEIIPNHICPVSNLYEKAYVINEGKVVEELIIEARAKLQ